MYDLPRGELGRTWTKIAGVEYGAREDERGPLGGGEGYAAGMNRGDHRVRTLDAMLAALKKARAGEVVFVEGESRIDCSPRVFIEKLVIEIPGGVTLAGNRGVDGSKGAMIFSDTLATHPLIRVLGPDVRITGLRLRGPDPERRLDHHRRSFVGGGGREYYYKFPISDGIECAHPRLEVDNCEMAGWSHAAIHLKAGDGHHIHHNFIHHNQYNGLGYGVCHDVASSLIECNLFDFNRHSIAGTGRPGCSYEARYNVELGESLSHCFDMHGGRDRKDGTDIAGTRIEIHHNCFRAHQRAVVIRGVPQVEALVHHNWFFHSNRGDRCVRHGARARVYDNAYGLVEPRKQLEW